MGGVICSLLLCLFYVLYKGESFHAIGLRVGILKEDERAAPDYWCMVGWTRCLQKMKNLECDACFFGHSQIASSNFQLQFPDKKIIELGYPGDNMRKMVRRVPQIVAVHPKRVFVLAGTNSLKVSKDDFEESFKSLMTAIIRSCPQSKVYCFNIIPQANGRLGNSKMNAIIRERNRFISFYCRSKGLEMIDIYKLFVDHEGNLKSVYSKDGIHITDEAYGVWAKSIKRYIYN